MKLFNKKHALTGKRGLTSIVPVVYFAKLIKISQ